MAKAHFIVPTAPSAPSVTVRLGSAAGAANNLSDLDEGKLARLTTESGYDLAAAGTDIEGVITSVESAPSNGWSIGGVQRGIQGDYMYATADGLQATPGTGTLTLGGIVVAGTATAKGTALAAYPKVCLATTPANVVHKWRVVSLGTGAGAVGSTVVLERI